MLMHGHKENSSSHTIYSMVRKQDMRIAELNQAKGVGYEWGKG